MSQTATVELQARSIPVAIPASADNSSNVSVPSGRQRDDAGMRKDETFREPDANVAVEQVLPSPVGATEESQSWNKPKENTFRVFACLWAFLMLGANDAAYGALIPYLEEYYDLTYTVVSLIFLAPFVGYTFAALLNNEIHMRFGQRGITLISPIIKTVVYITISQHPPYPALVVMFLAAGFANGLEDSAWNAWIGAMANANQILGILHGLYGAGAALSPLIATSLITKAHWPWWSFYYLMIGGAVIEAVTSIWAFWPQSGAVFRRAHPVTTNRTDNRMKEALLTRPSARVTWLCAVFLLGYVGVEVALGGWIVTFMIRVREGTHFASGMTATGFWLGLTVGRVTLGFLTPKIGERLAISIYLPIAMALELVFWLVPQFYVSAVAVALQGYFLGPLFPAAIVAATRLLPKHLHVSAIGFAAAFGGGGAAIFPFAVGALAQARGVKVLQPVVLSLLGAILVLWLMLPRLGKKKD